MVVSGESDEIYPTISTATTTVTTNVNIIIIIINVIMPCSGRMENVLPAKVRFVSFVLSVWSYFISVSLCE